MATICSAATISTISSRGTCQAFRNTMASTCSGHPAAKARLWWAAEEAKKKLSFEPYVRSAKRRSSPRAASRCTWTSRLSRDQYEALIRPLVESTLDSASKALQDAGKKPGALDAILLVGGSTRTPLISHLLTERTGLEPRQEVHPDLCVALGAGVLASRLAGHDIERVLVDVSPYSFGVSYLGERGGVHIRTATSPSSREIHRCR